MAAPVGNQGFNVNYLSVLRRALAWFVWGESPTGIQQPIACLNGEGVLTPAYTSGQPTPASVPSGALSLIQTDGTSANNVIAPNGLTIPAGETLSVTSANALTVNGVIVPTAEHYSYYFDAAEAVSRTVFIAPTTLQLTGVNVVFGTASASGTVDVEHLTGTEAPGSGTVMLTGTLSTAGTINTVAPGTLAALTATLQLAVGDRVSILFSGTETGLVGLCVTLTFKRI